MVETGKIKIFNQALMKTLERIVVTVNSATQGGENEPAAFGGSATSRKSIIRLAGKAGSVSAELILTTGRYTLLVDKCRFVDLRL